MEPIRAECNFQSEFSTYQPASEELSRLVKRIDGYFILAKDFNYLPWPGVIEFERLLQPSVQLHNGDFLNGVPDWKGKQVMEIPLTLYGHLSIICFGSKNEEYSKRCLAKKQETLNKAQKCINQCLRKLIQQDNFLHPSSPTRRHMRYNLGSDNGIKICSEADFKLLGSKFDANYIREELRKVNLACFLSPASIGVEIVSYYLGQNMEVPTDSYKRKCLFENLLWHADLSQCENVKFGLHVAFDWETNENVNEVTYVRYFNINSAKNKVQQKSELAYTYDAYKPGVLPAGNAGNLVISNILDDNSGVKHVTLYKRSGTEIKSHPDFSFSNCKFSNKVHAEIFKPISRFLKLDGPADKLSQKSFNLEFRQLKMIFNLLRRVFKEDCDCRIEVVVSKPSVQKQELFKQMEDLICNSENWLRKHGIFSPDFLLLRQKDVSDHSFKILEICENTINYCLQSARIFCTQPTVFSTNSSEDWTHHTYFSLVAAEILMVYFLHGYYNAKLTWQEYILSNTFRYIGAHTGLQSTDIISDTALSVNLLAKDSLANVNIGNERRQIIWIPKFAVQYLEKIMKSSEDRLLILRQDFKMYMTGRQPDISTFFEKLFFFLFLSKQYSSLSEQQNEVAKRYLMLPQPTLSQMTLSQLETRLVKGKGSCTTEPCGIYLFQRIMQLVLEKESTTTEHVLLNIWRKLVSNKLLSEGHPLVWKTNETQEPLQIGRRNRNIRPDPIYVAFPTIEDLEMEVPSSERINSLSRLLFQTVLLSSGKEFPSHLGDRFIPWCIRILSNLEFTGIWKENLAIRCLKNFLVPKLSALLTYPQEVSVQTGDATQLSMSDDDKKIIESLLQMTT